MGTTLCHKAWLLGDRECSHLAGALTALLLWDHYHVIPLISFPVQTPRLTCSFVGAPVRIDKDCRNFFCASTYLIHPPIFLSPSLQGYFVELRYLQHLTHDLSAIHRCCRLPRPAISCRRAIGIVGICQRVLATPRSLAHHFVPHGRF